MSEQKKGINFVWKIFIGLALGIIFGLLMQNHVDVVNTFIKPWGTLFMNLLKMVIVPLVFFSLISGTIGIGDIKKVGRIGGKSLLFFACTTVIAIIIAMLLSNLFKVWQVERFISIDYDAELELAEANSLMDTLLNIIPTNPVLALSEGNMLQIIVFAMFFGFGMLALGERAHTLGNVVAVSAEVMYKITDWIIKLMPYAVFCLIAPVAAENGPEVLLPLMSVIAVVYLSCLIHGLLIYSIILRVLAKVNPLSFYKEALPAILFAFSSTSSSASIPLSMEVSQKIGVPMPIRSFVLPLGATIHMDGTAIYQGACALFVAQICDVHLSMGQILTIIITAVFSAIGTAGIPGAAVVLLSMTLQAVGLPLEGIALIVGIDRVLDMARTALNVAGDVACGVVIAASEGELDPEKTKNEDIEELLAAVE